MSALAGPGLFIAGMLLLLGGFWLVSTFNGLVAGSLAPWAFVLILVAGAAFVHCQCLGALLILRSACRLKQELPSKRLTEQRIPHD